ncbi:MAG: glycosyl transferase [Methylophilaceae bacterium 17-44-8]|jgi:glycosyltransferase involved in cell wall biosynthesis|nr:MAG: glycosyl transferase [Methylophilales bacterium 28-44-11]OZA05583.1 MAG: glycosyl transferase [Methylophilaceae bacterium 17-44-8]
MSDRNEKWVMQIAHSYYPPFLDCARQYAALFQGSQYKVLTVYLTGESNPAVEAGSTSHQVIFLGYKSKQVSGLKLDAIAKIKRIASKKQFQFCIAHRVKPTYTALLATNLPVISVHHNYNDYSRWSRRLLVDFYQKRLLMLGVSDSVRDDLRHDLKNWPPERILTLYNRIDLDVTKAGFVSKDEARAVLGLAKNAYVIGNVGRLHRDKDQTTLLKAFAHALPQLPQHSILAIMGMGPLEAHLKSLAEQLGISHAVRFTGNIPDGKRYFNAFDLFTLTSDHEPFGMVLLEAMAANLPIICSDSGGGAEIVQGLGDLFPLGDAKALAERMVINAYRPPNIFNIEQRLTAHFTDAAVKTKFWNIEYIKTIIEN